MCSSMCRLTLGVIATLLHGLGLLSGLVHGSSMERPESFVEWTWLRIYCPQRELSLSAGFFGLQRPYCHSKSEYLSSLPAMGQPSLVIEHLQEESKESWTVIRIQDPRLATLASVGRRIVHEGHRDRDELKTIMVTAQGSAVVLYVDGETTHIIRASRQVLRVSKDAFFVLALSPGDRPSDPVRCLTAIQTAAKITKSVEPKILTWLVDLWNEEVCRSLVLVFTRPVENHIGLTRNLVLTPRFFHDASRLKEEMLGLLGGDPAPALSRETGCPVTRSAAQ